MWGGNYSSLCQKSERNPEMFRKMLRLPFTHEAFWTLMTNLVLFFFYRQHRLRNTNTKNIPNHRQASFHSHNVELFSLLLRLSQDLLTQHD